MTSTDFYPRPPRGGRPRIPCDPVPRERISIHALREEGDTGPRCRRAAELISIHALREEGDLGNTAALSVTTIFLSTPSARRATINQLRQAFQIQFLSTPSARRATTAFPASSTITKISIHALREEGDAFTIVSSKTQQYFYPRPPRGGRRVTVQLEIWHTYFYPRPPRGGRLPLAQTGLSTS